MVRMLMSFALALSLLTAVPSAAASAAESVAAIRALLLDDKLTDAIKKGEEATKVNPDDAVLWMWLGRAYGRQALEANLLMKASWAGKCRDAWEKAVALDPDNAEARFDLMQYYAQAPGMLGGGMDKAKAEAEKIAALNPAWGHIARGSLAMIDKDQNTAETEYRAAIAAAPTDFRARSVWTGFLSRGERWDELIAFWNEQAIAYPDDAYVAFQVGRAAAMSGQNLEAGLAALDRYMTMDGKPTVEQLAAGAAEWRRGQVLEKLGRRDDAITAFEAAVAINPAFEEPAADLKRLRARG